jgi:hypothetical protein
MEAKREAASGGVKAGDVATLAILFGVAARFA